MQFNASNSAIYVMSISRQVSQHRLHYMYQLCGVVLDIVQFSGEISWHLTLPRYVLVKSYTYYSNESPPETRFSPSQPAEEVHLTVRNLLMLLWCVPHLSMSL